MSPSSPESAISLSRLRPGWNSSRWSTISTRPAASAAATARSASATDWASGFSTKQCLPASSTATPLEPLRPQIDAAIAAVLDDKRFILGPNVGAFEEEFAAACGARHAIGVANGTDALTIALRAMGVGPGDEVVVPSFTFYASAEAIPPTGARPVFCDVDTDTFCVTPGTVRAALTARTRAVVAVDLFGNVAPTPEIEELGVPVLVDSAQAAGSTRDGARAGSLGTAATLSFFPSKNLPGFGDGGAVLTDA